MASAGKRAATTSEKAKPKKKPGRKKNLEPAAAPVPAEEKEEDINSLSIECIIVWSTKCMETPLSKSAHLLRGPPGVPRSRIVSLVQDDTLIKAIDVSSDGEDSEEFPLTVKPVKRNRADTPVDEKEPITKKTKPQPSTSAPSAPAPPTDVKNRFAATVLAEEETAQRALSLEKEKHRTHQRW
ncbi:hypothetical protein B0H19DRAFT_1083577 [Mycena capillaripes]|nr:hypothetical protein B0H19DRAFT_1083577 [Mycena capillaripes]